MKTFICLFLALGIIPIITFGQQEAITKDGKRVLLFDNGTWKYKNASKTLKIEMVSVEGGTGMMGCRDDECSKDEEPQHKALLKGFFIGKYEVKVSEYKQFCESTGHSMPAQPDWGWNDNHPVVNVSYDDAVAFCEWLSKTSGKKYRLPTEAEWEYAARGGNRTKDFKYSGSDKAEDVAWFSPLAKSTNEVGQKKPNELGIYDMSGNVYEWCFDWYSKDYYKNAELRFPKGPASGNNRVIRGGSWAFDASQSRVAKRYKRDPGYKYYGLGFRVVLEK